MQHEVIGRPRDAGEDVAPPIRGGAGPVPKQNLVCARFRLDYDEKEEKEFITLLTDIRDELKLARTDLQAYQAERRWDRRLDALWGCLSGIGSFCASRLCSR